MDIGSLTGQLTIENQLSGVLNVATQRVKQFAVEFSALTSTIVLGGAAIVGAFTAITGSIIALGNRGADVNDVAITFKNFSGSVATADATLAKMREGTLGTVTDFDLMKSASKLLAADVQLTSDQFGTLTQAAFVLQNQGLGPTKDMLELVSQAMLTGRTRTLEMKIGKIDLRKAEENYAKSLRVGRDQLSELGKTEARRTAILEALNKKVREAGAQQRDFGEMMEFAVVSVRNWGDQLASQVASSPNVINAVRSIGDALSSTFGTAGQTAIQGIVGWINRFADLVTYYAPIVIKWVGNIINEVRTFYNRVLEYWDTAPDWFKRIAAQAVITAGVLYVSKEAIQGVTEATDNALGVSASFATIVSGTNDAVKALIAAQIRWADSTWAAARAVKALALQVQFFGIQQSASLAGMYLWNAGIGTVVTSLTGLGTAIGIFLLTPLGLVTVAIPALIGGLRLLTGSWDFLLTPLRYAWQALKDVWSITTDVSASIYEDLKPALQLLGETFTLVGDVISTYFTAKIKQARDDLNLLWALVRSTPQFANLVEDFKTLNAAGEFARGKFPTPGSPTGFGGLGGVPAPTVIPPSSLPEGPLAAIPKSSKDLFTSPLDEKIKALTKSWREAGIESQAFTQAFSGLTAEQRANLDIQALLVPEINKLLAAQKAITPAMEAVLNAEQKRRLGLAESNRLTLEASDLTLTSLEGMKRANLTEADIARSYGVTTEALGKRVTAMQEAETRAQSLASFESALVEQNARDAKRKEEQALAANLAIADSERELNDLLRQQSMTTTEYQIQKIQEEETAAVVAFSTSGATAEAIKSFMEFRKKISEEKTAALLVDEESLKNRSRQNLQEIADRARRTYEIMKANPQEYSKATIREFKRISESAQHEADGTKSAWDKAYGAMGDVADILDAIPGKFAEIGAMATRAGQAIMENLAEGDVWGAVIAGATAAVSIVGKLFGLGPTDYEKRVRAANEEMKKLTTDATKAAGSMERLALNASMVGIHIKGAFDSGDPEFLSQILGEMQDKTQKLTSAMQEYGFTWEDLGEQYRNAALGDQFTELFEKTQLLKGAGIDYSTILERQAEDYSSLVQAAIRTGSEIPAAMQPVLQDLLEMGKLVDANGVAFTDLDDLSWAKTLTQGFDQVTDAIHELTDALVNGVGGALDDIGSRVVRPRINPIWEGPESGVRPEEVQPAYYADGGNVVAFRPRGSDTVPAMLTPGERVIPRGTAPTKVIVELDKRWLAEIIAPEIPGAVKRMGIR